MWVINAKYQWTLQQFKKWGYRREKRDSLWCPVLPLMSGSCVALALLFEGVSRVIWGQVRGRDRVGEGDQQPQARQEPRLLPAGTELPRFSLAFRPPFSPAQAQAPVACTLNATSAARTDISLTNPPLHRFFPSLFAQHAKEVCLVAKKGEDPPGYCKGAGSDIIFAPRRARLHAVSTRG